MEFLKSVLETIRKLDLTVIGQTALSGFGWFGRIIGGFLMKVAEIFIDKEIQKIENSIDNIENDKARQEKAKENAAKINNAKTDSEFDSAARDSLK